MCESTFTHYTSSLMELWLSHLKLGDVPRIAGVLTDADVLTMKEESLGPLDIIELRVDMFDTISPDHVEKIFRRAREAFKKPIIATVRALHEGGQREITDRLGLYRAALPFSDAVDVEMSSEDTLARVKEDLRKHTSLLIGSYHNFESTPDVPFLETMVAKADRWGVDIVKIAAMAQKRDDMIRLLLFTDKYRERGLITMSMGDTGLLSRVVGPFFGSLITYGYVNRPSAPGQLSVLELADFFRRLQAR